MKRDRRTVQQRWDAAQDTRDCGETPALAPHLRGCMHRKSPFFTGNGLHLHRDVASMQLDGIDHRKLP